MRRIEATFLFFVSGHFSSNNIKSVFCFRALCLSWNSRSFSFDCGRFRTTFGHSGSRGISFSPVEHGWLTMLTIELPTYLLRFDTNLFTKIWYDRWCQIVFIFSSTWKVMHTPNLPGLQPLQSMLRQWAIMLLMIGTHECNRADSGFWNCWAWKI